MITEQTAQHIILTEAGIIIGCSCGYRTDARGPERRLDAVKEHIASAKPMSGCGPWEPIAVVLPDDEDADEDVPLVTDAYDMEGRQ